MVSDFHRLRIQMTLLSMPPRSISMSPLAQRDRADTSSSLRPNVLPMQRTLLRIALVRSWILRMRHCVLSW